MDEGSRLARIEALAQFEAQANAEFRRDFREYVKLQRIHNDRHYETRDRLNALEAQKKGAFFVLTIVASGISAASSFLIQFFRT